jgi:predicted nuclease with TOPRIM domain
VTDVKSFIDGMRSSRDTKMADLNALKTQLKEQNQRLLQVTQEKARIEAKNKVSQQRVEDGRGKFPEIHSSSLVD